MATHGYYSTAHWKSLRLAALLRDGGRCVVCGRRATHADHIVTRPRVPYPTPLDRLDNLRSLCTTHDAQMKEHAGGRRAAARIKGCDAQGWPLGT